MGSTISALLQTVNAAVTPVVLISASAVLIMGVNNKHQAHADRLRILAAELRNQNTTSRRLACVRSQIDLFRRRYRFSKIAHLVLYISVFCYCLMVLVLAFFRDSAVSHQIVLGLLVCGISFTCLACILEVVEVNLGESTILMEVGASMEECPLEKE